MLRETPVLIDGPCGPLEALHQDLQDPRGVALVCHPHPLYGGTMLNKVVSSLQRTARDQGLATVRFNFRGVGHSAGEHDLGRGEVDDAEAAARWLMKLYPGKPIQVMGFSFGSCVAACLAGRLEQAGEDVAGLLMVGPPVERFPLEGRLPEHCRMTVIQPEDDEVVTPEKVYQWSAALRRPHELLKVAECGHFFHGKLVELKALVQSRV